MTILKTDTVSGIGTEGTVFEGDITFDSLNYMTLPKGTTTQSNRGRGILSGGYTPTPTGTYNATIQYLQIQSQGNTIDFGDLTVGRSEMGSSASSTRGVNGGGYTESPSAAKLNTIDYITIATTANATDFGDLLSTNQTGPGACGSNTRGIIAWGGRNNSNTLINNIEYITIATTGNGTDFGDATSASRADAKCSSPTRGIRGAGYISAAINLIEYLTIATTGNATDFGDLVTAQFGGRSSSSNTRCVWGGGGPSAKNEIQYVEIATTGNSVDFGDLTQGRQANSSVGNSIRGVWGGGYTPTFVNTIDYVTIATTGNANDFGDANSLSRNLGALSDSHGGLSE